MKKNFLFVLVALIALIAFCSCSSSSSNQNETELSVYTKVVRRAAVDVGGRFVSVIFTDGGCKYFSHSDVNDLIYFVAKGDTIVYSEDQDFNIKKCNVYLKGGNFFPLEKYNTVHEKVVKQRITLFLGNGTPVGAVRYEDNSYSFFSKGAHFIQYVEVGDTLLYKPLNNRTREAVPVAIRKDNLYLSSGK